MKNLIARREHHRPDAVSFVERLVGSAQAMLALVRRAQFYLIKRRSRAATYRSLRQLDNRMLHDLGLDRSEILSVAVEACGDAADTRIFSRPATRPNEHPGDSRKRLHVYSRG